MSPSKDFQCEETAEEKQAPELSKMKKDVRFTGYELLRKPLRKKKVEWKNLKKKIIIFKKQIKIKT